MIDTKLLNKILELLQADFTPTKTYETVCNLIKQAVQYESATLFIYNELTKKMEIVHQSGEVVVDLLNQFDFGSGTGLSGWVSSKKDIIIIPSLSKSRVGKEGFFQSFASLPLFIGDRLIGVLNLGHSEPNIFKTEDSPSFSKLASQISLVLEQIQLREKLSIKNEKLQNALQDLETAQEKLVENERLAAIGEIVGTVNHEINNPLASIMGLTDILSMSIHTLSPDKVSNSLKLIMKESQRIQKITEKLMTIRSSNSDNYLGKVKMTALPQ